MTELDEAIAEGHEPQDKGLQLGVDPDDVEGDDRTYVQDDAARDALWGSAKTVEQTAAELEELTGEEPDVIAALLEAKKNG